VRIFASSVRSESRVFDMRILVSLLISSIIFFSRLLALGSYYGVIGFAKDDSLLNRKSLTTNFNSKM
jgi:hypothetical protein